MKSIIHRLLSEEPKSLKFVGPFVLFMVCFVVRLIKLTAQDISIDEPFTIYHAQFSVPEIIRYLEPTNNPPLFEIILHYWIRIFGISEFLVRFLPALFSSLAVIYIYKSGAKFFSFGIGITASFLYIFSSHSIYYAHDCRVYSLFLFLAAASLYFFLKVISAEHSRKDAMLLVVVNVLMVYSHYFGFIVWFTEFVFMLLYSRENLRQILVLFALALFFYFPQLFILASRFLHSAGGTWVKEPNGVEAVYNMLWKFCNMPVTTVFCLFILVASLIMLFVRKEKWNYGKRFFFFSFIVPFLLMFFVSFFIPVFNPRYLTFLLPAFYISISFLAFDLFSLEKYKFILPSLLAVFFIGTVDIDPDKKREARKVTEFINTNRTPGDIVIMCTHEFLTNYAYYTDKSLFQTKGDDEYSAIEDELLKNNIYPVRNIKEIHPSLLENAKRIIYLDAGADFSNPGNNVLATLRGIRTEKKKTHFKAIFDVYEFE